MVDIVIDNDVKIPESSRGSPKKGHITKGSTPWYVQKLEVGQSFSMLNPMNLYTARKKIKALHPEREFRICQMPDGTRRIFRTA